MLLELYTLGVFVIARAVRLVAPLRLSRGQSQSCLNYAEAKQRRPKVNLPLLILNTIREISTLITFARNDGLGLPPPKVDIFDF